MSPTVENGSVESPVSPQVERRNMVGFAVAVSLTYLSAPISFVGIVQATLCRALGAGSTVSNLPSAAYMGGSILPLIITSLVPRQYERLAFILFSLVSSISLGLVSLVLYLPAPASLRVGAVVGQSLVLGLTWSVQIVYLFQCLKLGTSSEGRAKAFKVTYTLGPIFAIFAALYTQLILGHHSARLEFPRNFAVLFLIACLCQGGIAFVASRFVLPPTAEEARHKLLPTLLHTLRRTVHSRDLMVLWCSFALWDFAIEAAPNLSLNIATAMKLPPHQMVGIALALRFGSKSLSGWAHGQMTQKRGPRAPLVSMLILMLVMAAWAAVAHGYLYLLVFCFMGAVELCEPYFRNYCLAFSTPETSAQNLAFLTLVSPLVTVSSIVHGRLADLLGFGASFVFAGAGAAGALALVLRLPRRPAANTV